MKIKKSFLVVLRIVFVVFSLKFLWDAFYKWDGYSFYMLFMEFLPDLSLSYLICTIIGVIFAVALWLIIYSLFKIISKFLIVIRLEHIMSFFIFIVLPVFIKRKFFSGFSISEFTSLSHSTILIIGSILTVVVVWFGRKHIEKYIDKILYGLDRHITPLVWFFAILVVLAVPFSVVHEESSKAKNNPDNSAHTTSQLDMYPGDRPDIILVIMDTLTSRDMQVYGYERPTTPFISEWARDAIKFNKAYSASNWTSSSVMSLMTGQRVWTHGVWHFVTNRRNANNYEENFPRVLKENGYNVYGFVQNDAAHPDIFGIKDNFSVIDKWLSFWIPDWWFSRLTDYFEDRPIVKHWIRGSFIAAEINAYHPDVLTTMSPPEMVYNRFLDYISQTQHRKSQQPFFAYLHVQPPHNPYLPPQPYMGLFGDAGRYNTEKKINAGHFIHTEYDTDRQDDIDILRKRYDEFILYSDQQFKQFLLRLDETIDMSNTIIFFSSDHGESFSHGYQGHGGPHLYEAIIHVPLIIRMPGEINSKEIDMPIDQVDIAPTILDLADIPIPDWMEGRSLLPVLNGLIIQPKPVFSMQFRNNRGLGYPISKGTVAVMEGDYKLIYYITEKKTMLFNLRSDPDEKLNISSKNPEIVQPLVKLITDNLLRVNNKITQSLEK